MLLGYFSDHAVYILTSCVMTDNGMLIDLLNDKIRQWERKCDEQRKEINRLKKQLREIKKNESEGE